ncbi:helix-turn-helix domain-containing protein [Massilia sp. S19_KUP03_FR1]|uniref:helix-turn-helix domain-containing protein n=1 Tax=Massilia sp. S19_KUP03_FR1 TaxID=3025503 RepID=UPI002FCDDB4C
MGRNLDDIIHSLPAERQAKIARAADQKVADMLAHATTLAEFRKAVGKTQAEVASELGIGQNAVSQMEQRADTYVSTLRRYLKSLGMTLELSVVDKDGDRYDLPYFLPWQATGLEVNQQAASYAAEKTSSAATPAVRANRRKPGAA